MRTFKSHTNEGRVTPALVKGLGFMLRNKLSQKIKSGKASKDLSQKLDALLDAQGIIGSIGIMNIGMEDGGQSLMSRSIIIRGLINELHEDGKITQSEKELLIYPYFTCTHDSKLVISRNTCSINSLLMSTQALPTTTASCIGNACIPSSFSPRRTLMSI